MEGTDGREILLSAFTEKEWRRVPSEIAKKLETYIGTKFNELIRHKALMETKNSSAVQNLTEIQGKYDELKQDHEKVSKKLTHANNAITELENQLTNSVTDVSKLQVNCNKLESDFNELRNQRNALMAEKEKVCRMLERRKLEVDRMECEMNTLTKQLEEAISAKCEALNKINEANSMKLAIEYKEQHLEREKSLLKSQIASLTKDLDERTEELLSMKRDSSSRCVQLEIKLSERTQELDNANENIKLMTEKNNNLIAKTEELIQKLSHEKENYHKTLEAYQNEVDSQKRIAELYKTASETQTSHAEELTAAAQELKEKLDEALEKYGDLETKNKEMELSHEEVLAKKTEYIEMLKKELSTANDLITNRPDISPDDEEVMPKFKGGMSVTEIYSRYVQVTETLAQEKAENKRLQSYIQSIVQEIEEKGPLIAKQRELYENAIDTIEDMTKKLDAMTVENQQLRDMKADLKRSSLSTDRENERLKREVTDLSRQVCHLLREVELSRTGSSVNSIDHDLSDSTCSADIISKRLVTFSDISELQSTNARLLALVRELSSKQEEAETMDPEMIRLMKEKLDQMREQQAAYLEEQANNNTMIKTLVEQRDTYKNLYHQFIKVGQTELADSDKSPTSKTNDDSEMQSDEKQQEYEQMIQKKTKEVAMLKEELDTYKLEKAANEKIILEQSEKLRSELQELMRQNTKLSAKCETTDEMIKITKNNADVYKGQIERLEDRVRIYNESIVKHEASQEYLKQQVMETQTKLAKVESQLGNLQKENMLLRDSENRLKYERDHLIREHQSNSTMLANIELIKATLERNDAESKMRLEDILKDSHRECAALRLRLQQEQDRFRELGDNLKKKTDAAQKRMEEEKQIADSLREELNLARENIATKSQQLDELAKKLKNPILDELEVSVERRKIRELEQNLFDSKSYVESLTEKLRISKDAVEQHRSIAQAAEMQLKDLKAQFASDKQEFEKQIAELQQKIETLTEQNCELQGELSLQSDGQVNATSTLHGKLNKLEIQNKVLSDDLSSTKSLLDDAKDQIKQLQDNINLAENKYIQEMKARSEELQVLHSIKEERVKLIDELNDVKSKRDQLQDAFDESKCSWTNQESLYKKAKEELETQTEELNKQNSLLLNQLETINEQMALLHAKISDPNRSIGDTSLNKSFIEDESKSSDQLVKIIKYLRREKDLAINKCEILEAEHNRIIAEQEVLKRQSEEAKKALESERQETEVSVVTAARHAEVLRKVETLNALTDSNRSLRTERDLLINELNELKKRTTNLEEQMTPMQEKNNELQKKSEALQTENITLRGEATRWRQRANILIEKSNRTSPEDWKKLQQERETLAKQLTIERGNTAKLTEENTNLRGENQKLEEQLRNLSTQLDQQRAETNKLNEELTTLRAQLTNLNQELDQARVQNINANEENRKLNETLANKEVVMNDVKNNLIQIRKIAKKYKIQFEEQQKEVEALKQQIQQKENDSTSDEKREEMLQQTRNELEQQIMQLNQTHNDRINELNVQVNSSQEEYEKSRKEIDSLNERLSTSHEKEERFKVLFKNAKDRIVNLTEQNNALKLQIENKDNNGDNQQGSSNDNGDLQRCQKEKEDLINEMQQDKEKFLREIETLTQRVNQLQRQLGLQQGSKPSTSSEKEKSTTEPPTANIKPMAGHSTNTQTQSVSIQPWRSGGEPPLASIRPMSQQRTAAVLPTSQSPSTVMVPPQQQVHTTGNSGIEAMSSSPTSSHTDYVPATSSASLLGPRQVAVPPTQSNQDNEDDDSNLQVQQVQQQQGVAMAMVLPRVEPPSPAQEQGTSSSSSNTVTTSQAGHKRPREREPSSDGGEDSKTSQQPKRTRIVQGTSTSGADGSVSESGLEVEYQVPTSSQRDHEDAVIVVESDEEGPDEGDGDDYNMPYEDADQDDEGGNEVEVIEDSSEVPNQSERGENDMQADGDEEEDCEAAEEREEEEETMQPEATSSGTSISTSVAVTLPSFARTRVAPLTRSQQANLSTAQGLGENAEEDKSMQPEATSSGTNVSTSVAVTLPSFSRTRVAPLTRSQQGNLILPTMDEGGDDGIVPSTPTLATSRRCDGFGDAVSSPHVPSGRFTFMESTAPSNTTNDVLPEQTLEMSSHADDNSTGRSVPNTPLQTSPHDTGPSCEEQPAHHSAEAAIPEITISGAEDDTEPAEGGDCMGPPSVAGTSTEVSHTDQPEESQEGEDAVSSEGEKTATAEESEEEGREAEASPSTNTRSRNTRGTLPTARRGVRGTHVRGIARHNPQPIVWGDQSDMQQRPANMGPGPAHRGRGSPNPMMFSPRGTRRNRARRSSFGGRY